MFVVRPGRKRTDPGRRRANVIAQEEEETAMTAMTSSTIVEEDEERERHRLVNEEGERSQAVTRILRVFSDQKMRIPSRRKKKGSVSIARARASSNVDANFGRKNHARGARPPCSSLLRTKKKNIAVKSRRKGRAARRICFYFSSGGKSKGSIPSFRESSFHLNFASSAD